MAKRMRFGTKTGRATGTNKKYSFEATESERKEV